MTEAADKKESAMPPAPDMNPQIESLLQECDVGREVCRSIFKEVQEDSDTRGRLKSFGVRTVDEYEDLLARLQDSRILYRERVLRPWDEIRDAQGQSECLMNKLRFDGSCGVLLLVDPYPGANWGHPCWIATFDVDHRKIRHALNDFPPMETADRRLVPLRVTSMHER